MKDGIIKADGTSRLARSVADFKTKYPTYDAFASALVTGTLPLDILFNEAGWRQLPDFLNQANLLKATTAALYGKDSTAVPDDIFAMIPGLLGEKLRMDLLWKNASPTSSFAAQTVSLDLSEYDMCIVCFKDSTNVTLLVPKGMGGKAYLPAQDTSYQWARDVSISNTDVTFGDGKRFNSIQEQWTYNSNMIPTQIYGIKGVQA